jgi:hypothetical protein
VNVFVFHFFYNIFLLFNSAFNVTSYITHLQRRVSLSWDFILQFDIPKMCYLASLFFVFGHSFFLCYINLIQFLVRQHAEAKEVPHGRPAMRAVPGLVHGAHVTQEAGHVGMA